MRLMRVSSLLPFLLFLGGFPCAGFLDLSPVPECRGDVLTNTPNTIGYETEAALEEELLELTNQHRIGQGLRALASDDALMQIAREHSYEMAQQGFISHDLPSEISKPGCIAPAIYMR
jgi:uncharacterized protein YkwD